MADGKKVILHVDDDSDCREIVSAVLEAEGYEVAQADSAEAGLRAFKETRPDFVLVDMMMEEVDSGVQLAKDIRIEDREVPMYMLSGAGDELHMNINEGDLGLSGVFQKPLDPERMVKTIKNHIG